MNVNNAQEFTSNPQFLRSIERDSWINQLINNPSQKVTITQDFHARKGISGLIKGIMHNLRICFSSSYKKKYNVAVLNLSNQIDGYLREKNIAVLASAANTIRKAAVPILQTEKSNPVEVPLAPNRDEKKNASRELARQQVELKNGIDQKSAQFEKLQTDIDEVVEELGRIQTKLGSLAQDKNTHTQKHTELLNDLEKINNKLGADLAKKNTLLGEIENPPIGAAMELASAQTLISNIVAGYKQCQNFKISLTLNTEMFLSVLEKEILHEQRKRITTFINTYPHLYPQNSEKEKEDAVWRDLNLEKSQPGFLQNKVQTHFDLIKEEIKTEKLQRIEDLNKEIKLLGTIKEESSSELNSVGSTLSAINEHRNALLAEQEQFLRIVHDLTTKKDLLANEIRTGKSELAVIENSLGVAGQISRSPITLDKVVDLDQDDQNLEDSKNMNQKASDGPTILDMQSVKESVVSSRTSANKQFESTNPEEKSNDTEIQIPLVSVRSEEQEALLKEVIETISTKASPVLGTLMQKLFVPGVAEYIKSFDVKGDDFEITLHRPMQIWTETKTKTQAGAIFQVGDNENKDKEVKVIGSLKDRTINFSSGFHVFTHRSMFNFVERGVIGDFAGEIKHLGIVSFEISKNQKRITLKVIPERKLSAGYTLDEIYKGWGQAVLLENEIDPAEYLVTKWSNRTK
jgi:predicted nuclease with TOPRIM domain